MNMLPGDAKPLAPSGVRLGVQELTRVGMGTGEMEQVAGLFQRALLEGEEPARVRRDVAAFKSRFQQVRYCFNDAGMGGYEFVELAAGRPALARFS